MQPLEAHQPRQYRSKSGTTAPTVLPRVTTVPTTAEARGIPVVGAVLAHGTTTGWYYRTGHGITALGEPGSQCHHDKLLHDAIENMWVPRVCMCDDSTHHSYDSIYRKEIERKRLLL